MATILVWPPVAFSISRMRPVASKPSISGICTSIKMRSKVPSPKAFTASHPLAAWTRTLSLFFQNAGGHCAINDIVFRQEDAQMRSGQINPGPAGIEVAGISAFAAAADCDQNRIEQI